DVRRCSCNHKKREVKATAWLSSITTMNESRREALAAAAPALTTASSSTAGSNTTSIAGSGTGEKDEAFSKLKNKFMNELNKIPWMPGMYSTPTSGRALTRWGC
ncbi:hypothetical protein AMECASPLE_020121, partial [Ameca splendens]